MLKSFEVLVTQHVTHVTFISSFISSHRCSSSVLLGVPGLCFYDDSLMLGKKLTGLLAVALKVRAGSRCTC